MILNTMHRRQQNKNSLRQTNCVSNIASAMFVMALWWPLASAQINELGAHELVGGNQALASNSLIGGLSGAQNSLIKDLSGPTSGKISNLDVICGKNFMTVRAEFSGPFYGIVFSKGTYGHENCIYVKPNSGLTHAAFNVYYDQCGTKPDLQGKFYENTIIIQYGSDIIEAYDEAKRLRCEWFEAYEKPATFKPAIPVADLDVVEMNFQGDDIDCWMEIQDGNGPWSQEVSKIVPVGQPMTIVVAINDYNGQFDMRVKSCVAHDGVQQPIALTDEYGCVLRPKMLTPFSKVRNPGPHTKATVLSYSRFLAFKFPDSMTVQIQCTVEVCRHGCADACQRIPSIAATTIRPELSIRGARWPTHLQKPAPESGESLPDLQPDAASLHSASFGQQAPTHQVKLAPQVSKFGMHTLNNRQQLSKFAGANALVDDMSSSDSNRLVSRVPEPLRHQIGSNARRQQPGDIELPHHIPQYMSPNQRRASSGASSGRPLPVAPVQQSTATPALSSTTASSSATTAQTSEPAAMKIYEFVNSDEDASATVKAPSGDRVVASSSVDEKQQSANDEAVSQQASGERKQNEASNVDSKQPIGEQPPASSNQSQQGSESLDQSQQQASSSQQQHHQQQPSVESAPVVGDQVAADSSINESIENTNLQKQQQQQYSSSSDSGKQQSVADGDDSKQQSSLKPVEVEVPANDEDPVRSLATGGIIASTQPQSFSSIRVPQQQQQQQDSSQEPVRYKLPTRGYDTSAINPREAPHNQEDAPDSKRNDNIGSKNDDGSFEALMNNAKLQFGTRSQPPRQQPSAASNHQPTGDSSNVNLVVGADEAKLSRVQIDRSDDSSSLFPSSVDSSGLINISISDKRLGDLQPAANGDSLANPMPTVGTDELASGPLQIAENRMGAQASSESAPQQAALTSSSQPDEPAKKSVDERLDIGSLLPSVRAKFSKSPQSINQQQQQKQQQQQQQLQQSNQADNAQQQQIVQQQQVTNSISAGTARPVSAASQPFPNIVGQAKVLPDPSTRGQPLNAEPAASVAPSQSSRQPSHSAPAQAVVDPLATSAQQIVAQITNVPMNPLAGSPQDMQQFNQQLALFQQQQQLKQQQYQQQQYQWQQHQLQQQQAQSTQKPKRFSLMSPHSAFQAVASRFLSHKTPATKAPTPVLMPQLLQLSPEQQKLFEAQLLKQFGPPKVSQNDVLQQQQEQQQQQQQVQESRGLLSRLSAKSLLSGGSSSAASKPLVRSRRSAIGSKGEVGIQKTFLVVNGVDLDFIPSAADRRPVPAIEGHREMSLGIMSGSICVPVVSLAFVLTCAFWLFVFIIGFLVYILTRARRLQRQHNQAKA